MNQKKLFYFNDARHYYLFVHEPPISMENAWGPVDEIADTGVDTFVYGIARGDGLFYPSKVGKRFGVDMGEFSNPMYWRGGGLFGEWGCVGGGGFWAPAPRGGVCV